MITKTKGHTIVNKRFTSSRMLVDMNLQRLNIGTTMSNSSSKPTITQKDAAVKKPITRVALIL